MAKSQLSELTLRLPRGTWPAIVLGVAVLITAPLLYIGLGLISVRKAIKPDEVARGRIVYGTAGWHRCGTPPPQTSDGRTSVRGSSERFSADLCINGYGSGVPVLLSERRTVLSWDQAVEFRLKPNRMTFDQRYALSAGTIRVASAIVPVMSVGDATVHDMEIYVALEHTLSKGFLGMDFLARMKWHKVVNGDTLLMIPHPLPPGSSDAMAATTSTAKK